MAFGFSLILKNCTWISAERKKQSAAFTVLFTNPASNESTFDKEFHHSAFLQIPCR
jgi:hypothetical protein